MTVLGVIPARFASVRFPGKPLVKILEKSMIQRVYEQALKSKLISEVIVATDNQQIYDTVIDFGGKVEMTSPNIDNGTERVAAVAEKHEHSLIVNIQGDEPLIDPLAIDKAIKLLIDDSSAVMGTLIKRIEDLTELNNPNLPKVVLDKNNNAIYFSRQAIPYCRDFSNSKEWLSNGKYFRHIGLYVYRKNFLNKYISLPISQLENIEKLEQLRVLEHGYKIKTAIVDYSPQGVDTPEDLLQIIKYLKDHSIE